jgi:hypothetical protein
MSRLIAIIGAITGWSAVGIQFYLMMINRTASIPETIIRFFSFFTILTNILVAASFTAHVIFRKDRAKFSRRQGTLAAIAVYITIVGLIYNLVLRSLWEPQGLQRVVDELLHSVIPVLFVFYWLVFVPKDRLVWKDSFSWLAYPLVYLLCILCRGAITGFYPYPFVNVSEIGYGKVLVNSMFIAGAFLLFSFLFIALSKFNTGKSPEAIE